MIAIRLTALFTVLVLLSSNASAAGRVLYVKGDTRYERAGRTAMLIKGATVEVGDLLVTGDDGRVQLVMDDGDRMSLRPGTRLRIDEFLASTTTGQPDTGRAFYSLIQGGFRALTRSQGRRDESSYRIRTPVATIGIRGTDYTLRICDGDCTEKDGLYAGVYGGGIRIGNGAGQLDLNKNEYGFVAGQNSAPRQLLAPPDLLKDVIGGGNGDGSTGDGLSNRTSPAEGEIDPRSPSIEVPGQPIQGTDPSGNPFDLTPGQEPGKRGGPPANVTEGQ